MKGRVTHTHPTLSKTLHTLPHLHHLRPTQVKKEKNLSSPMHTTFFSSKPITLFSTLHSSITSPSPSLKSFSSKQREETLTLPHAIMKVEVTSSLLVTSRSEEGPSSPLPSRNSALGVEEFLVSLKQGTLPLNMDSSKDKNSEHPPPSPPFKSVLGRSHPTSSIIRPSLPPLYPGSTSLFKAAYARPFVGKTSLLPKNFLRPLGEPTSPKPPPPKKRKTSNSKEYRKLFQKVEAEYTPLTPPREEFREGFGQSW